MTLSLLNMAALAEIFACWIAWSMAFVKPRREAQGAERVAQAPTSRWGLFVVMCGFGCIWAYVRPTDFHKTTPELIASMILAPPAVALVWAATRHLGKQWRFQAALNADHALVQTGPYRWLRHPIYSSMLAMMLATGLAWTWWPMLIAGLVFFLIGTEIRVRAEEQLLAGRFGCEFDAFKEKTWAYLPFLR
jgi:protein-S-isoprenylcysteine O-methyltransferase Ste14